MEKFIEIIKTLPKWVIALLLLYSSGLISYAVYDNRPIDLWVIKINARAETRGQTTSNRQQFIVLQAVQDANLNSVKLPDGSMITLLDVDSLSDSELSKTMNKVGNAIKRGNINDQDEIKIIIEKFFKHMLQSLNFNEADVKEAMNILYRHFNGDKDIDQSWEDFTKKIAKKDSYPNDFLKLIKREPFAILSIGEGATHRIDFVLPDEPIRIKDKTYAVPVMANPAKKVTRGIQEAIVIQLLNN